MSAIADATRDAPQRTARLHALDSLRAIMMLLGLVLHSAISYCVTDLGGAWRLKDAEATWLPFDLLVGYIHAFRMPVFFAIAGFFGALLFYERSPWAMVRNRLSRLVYPFVVFVFLLWPQVVFAFVFTEAAMAGAADPAGRAVAALADLRAWIPADPAHLWFLDYLIFFSAAGWLLAMALRRAPAAVAGRIRTAFERSMRSARLRPVICAAPTFGLLLAMGSTWPENAGGFLPEWRPLLNYFTFYLFGWLLYGARRRVPDLARGCWTLVVVASGLYCVEAFAELPGRVAATALNAVEVWCLVLGITGLFVRYGSGHSATMRFVSDASYWFYLIHLPLTALGAGLLIGTDLPAAVKFALVLGGTTAVCWVTYAYLVRGTFVGRFLNGRKYARPHRAAAHG